jgi:hypothetical protein
MAQQISKIDDLIDGSVAPLRRHLDEVPGMEAVAWHKWQWKTDEFAAEVAIEPGSAIRLSHEVATPPATFAALETNARLPGNLRYATCQHGSILTADTQLDGEAHLLTTFDRLRKGLRVALERESPLVDDVLAAADIRAAIAACRWPEGNIVELDTAWEFPVRLRGDATPVRAAIDGAELRMYRTVVTGVREGRNRDATSAQALRFNNHLRHARLAALGGDIVAESRLHAEQLTPTWLETAAWAVAVACRHTEAILNILAENDNVAADYAAAFLGEER